MLRLPATSAYPRSVARGSRSASAASGAPPGSSRSTTGAAAPAVWGIPLAGSARAASRRCSEVSPGSSRAPSSLCSATGRRRRFRSQASSRPSVARQKRQSES